VTVQSGVDYTMLRYFENRRENRGDFLLLLRIVVRTELEFIASLSLGFLGG
jgi:hypothetical protein